MASISANVVRLSFIFFNKPTNLTPYCPLSTFLPLLPQGGVAEAVGTASTGIASNLRNCAGKTASATVQFDAGSAVFWAEFSAPNGYAVQRADYSGGVFGSNSPIWKQGLTLNTLSGVANTDTSYPWSASSTWTVDNAIVGVSYYQWDGSTNVAAKQDVVYASSTTTLYASLNAFDSATSVSWYIVQKIGVGESAPLGQAGGSAVYGSSYLGSEYRGVAYAPRSCSATGQTFRALAAPAKAEEEETA